MASLSELVEEARLSARALLDYGDGLFNPTVRLGVTGLSRAGKTVFITALVHGLTRGGKFNHRGVRGDERAHPEWKNAHRQCRDQ